MTEQLRDIQANGIAMRVAVSGEGPAVVLVHGFPHTHRLWSSVAPGLSDAHRVIAPDLRGIGGSTRAADGYDARTLAADLRSLLDALDVERADLVAIDAGVPAAFALALQHPDRVRRLVLIESTLGSLPGAEEFFAGGAPWWFGFHQVPGLAETVLAGHEGAYLDFFYRAGTAEGTGIDPAVRDAFVADLTGTGSLRCAFEYYRAMPESARQLAELTAHRRLTVPTMSVGARPVGDTLRRQLAPLTDDLRAELIEHCGHIVPLDRPAELLTLLTDFLGT